MHVLMATVELPPRSRLDRRQIDCFDTDTVNGRNNDGGSKEDPTDRMVQQSEYYPGPRAVESFGGMKQSGQWPLPTRVKHTLSNHSDDG